MTEKNIIVLCGASGAGKTYARKRLPELRDLPCVDVADVYLDNPGITWLEATAGVISRTKALLKTSDVIVIEGYSVCRWLSECWPQFEPGHEGPFEWPQEEEREEIF